MCNTPKNQTTYVVKAFLKTPSPNSPTKIWITNHIIEMKVYDRGYANNSLERYRKVSKTEYLDTETGELIKVKTTPHQNRNVSSSSTRRNMNRSFEKLRHMINENFVCNPNEAHITLTYRGLMKDRDQVSEDFKKFWKRLKYQYPALEYIAVYELTGRYSWHVHVLVKNTGAESWSVKNAFVSEMWGHGYTKVSYIRNNDNVGAYFTSFVSGEKDGVSPKAVRMREYAKGKKLYTKSRGIRIPSPVEMSYAEAEEYLRGHHLVFSRMYSVRSVEDDREVARIYNYQYNDKRM